MGVCSEASTHHKCIFISIAGNAKDAAVDKLRYALITKGLMFLSTYHCFNFPLPHIFGSVETVNEFFSNVRKSLKLRALKSFYCI